MIARKPCERTATVLELDNEHAEPEEGVDEARQLVEDEDRQDEPRRLGERLRHRSACKSGDEADEHGGTTPSVHH